LLRRPSWFRSVHAKSASSEEVRALLVARKQLQGKLIELELSIRGIHRGFGPKVGDVTRKSFAVRLKELVASPLLARYRLESKGSAAIGLGQPRGSGGARMGAPDAQSIKGTGSAHPAADRPACRLAGDARSRVLS
jgi:hypothetical protein